MPLPGNTAGILANVTLCLITHGPKWGIKALGHTVHLDIPGRTFLKEHNIPVICRKKGA